MIFSQKNSKSPGKSGPHFDENYFYPYKTVQKAHIFYR